MTIPITAVFENGLLRPTTPLDISEGTEVQLLLVSEGKNGKPSGRAAASILAEIASLATGNGDPRTSQDHDKVLYGEQGAR